MPAARPWCVLGEPVVGWTQDQPARFADSVDALRALAEGRCLVAGFHVPKLAAGAKLFEKALEPLLTAPALTSRGYAGRFISPRVAFLRSLHAWVPRR